VNFAIGFSRHGQPARGFATRKSVCFQQEKNKEDERNEKTGEKALSRAGCMVASVI
jgi:hypothetical protein